METQIPKTPPAGIALLVSLILLLVSNALATTSAPHLLEAAAPLAVGGAAVQFFSGDEPAVVEVPVPEPVAPNTSP